jgi:pilus assembly protein CpaB
MPLRTIATLAVAILLGVIAVILVRGVVTSRGGAAGGPVGATPVVVAAAPIPRGATLTPTLLKVANFPADSVPAGSYRTVEQVLGKGGPPKVAMRELIANEPLVPEKLSGPSSKANLSGTLSPGMRAVSVRTGDVAGVGGFVLPGDRVDVLVTRQVGSGETSNTVVQVLAENARVLGVDQSSDADKPVVAKAVTLEVTPNQAQSISLAQSVGSVVLSLRQTADNAPLARKGMTVAELGYGGAVAKRPSTAATRPQGPQVRVTRGTEMSGYTLPN